MKTSSILTFIIALIALPAVAQAPQVVKPALTDGPNLALALMAVVQLIAIMALAGILRRLTRNTDYFIKLQKLREQGQKGILVLLFTVFAAKAATAQRAEIPEFPAFARDENTLLLLVLNAVLLMVFIYMVTLLRRTISLLMPELELRPEPVAVAPKQSAVLHALTDAVPLEREHEVLLDHEYDGIRELDNNLPPWWVWMFYVTIAISVVYMVWYHVLPFSQNQHEEYIAEVQKAEAEKQAYIALMGESVDENTVEFLADAEDMKAGRAIYMLHCQACHAADGGGGVGPNFTDNYWIHGGSISDIFRTIKYGVPQKGMVAWESQLRPKEMAQVASFIQTLVGTTPANPKEPQGTPYVAPDNSENQETEPLEEVPEAEESSESRTAHIK